MGTDKAEGKWSMKEIDDEEEEEDDEDIVEGLEFGDDDKIKKKGKRSSGGSSSIPLVSCQADNCTSDLTDAKRYHRRHKVCEFHAKAPYVPINGVQQRFCQQCSRFHDLSEFDDSKRSCRRRLAGHNERRRKSMAEYQGEGSN